MHILVTEAPQMTLQGIWGNMAVVFRQPHCKSIYHPINIVDLILEECIAALNLVRFSTVGAWQEVEGYTSIDASYIDRCIIHRLMYDTSYKLSYMYIDRTYLFIVCFTWFTSSLNRLVIWVRWHKPEYKLMPACRVSQCLWISNVQQKMFQAICAFPYLMAISH